MLYVPSTCGERTDCQLERQPDSLLWPLVKTPRPGLQPTSLWHWCFPPPNSLPKSLVTLFRPVEDGLHQPNETLMHLSRLTVPSVSPSSKGCGCPRNPGIARTQSLREGRIAFGSPLLLTFSGSRSLFHESKILLPGTPRRKMYTFP